MPPLTAVVTGANKGIGIEIARKIAQRSGTRTVLAARDEGRGRAALESVRNDAAEGSEVLFHQLDITDTSSVAAFADWARSELRSVDVLVNNAGFAYKGSAFGADEAEQTIGVNFRGTAAVTEALLPLIPEGGRIINIGSTSGKLSIIQDAALRARFEAAASKSELEQLADAFVGSIRRGRHSQEGWPTSMYGISKLCENQWSRVLAQQLQPRHIAVFAVCPGYVATDMSSHRGSLTPPQGADTPAWLAFLPGAEAEALSGKFIRERRVEPF